MIGAATAVTGPVAVAVLATLAGANPARRAQALTAPEGADPGRRRVAWAAALTAALVGVLALGAGGVLDALDVGEPTARVAAGLVLAVTGLAQVRGPTPRTVPGATEPGAVLVPLTFPHLLRPELALVALSTGADHGAVAVVLLALALGATVPALAIGTGRGDVLGGLGRLLGGIGVLAGVDLTVDGVVAL